MSFGEIKISSATQPPATAPIVAVDQNLAIVSSYLEGIAHKIPTPQTPAVSMSCKLGSDNVVLDMHRISILNNHYVASAGWENFDASLFWTMIAQEKPAMIVKLTPHQPNNRTLYWPNEINEQWKSQNPAIPTVTCKDIQSLSHNLVKRTFEVSAKGETFSISQLDFIGWTDLETPTVEDVESLLKEVMKVCPQSDPAKRILVHCEKGVGRTGTFIAAHATCMVPSAVKLAKDFYSNLIMDMRAQRPKPMVETPFQFLFLHQLASRPPLDLSAPSAVQASSQISVNHLGLAPLQAAALNRMHYHADLLKNIDSLFSKLNNFEANADDIVDLCVKGLIGLSQGPEYVKYDCTQAFDSHLVGMLGNTVQYGYVFDNAYTDSKKLRKGGPLCIIKAMSLNGTPAQAKAFQAVEILIKDYLDHCQGSVHGIHIRLVLYALSKAYYDHMSDKTLAAANLKKWWCNNEAHLNCLKSGIHNGPKQIIYAIPL